MWIELKYCGVHYIKQIKADSWVQQTAKGLDPLPSSSFLPPAPGLSKVLSAMEEVPAGWLCE